MNKIEKIIYDLVKANPGLKNAVRNLYQMAFDLLPQQKEFFINPIQVAEGYFFGFHDICPFSVDQTKVLAARADIFLTMPGLSDELSIGFFDFDSGKLGDFTKLAVSFAWNYHKGCRLQWLNQQTIIFNTAVNGSVISRAMNLQSKQYKDLNFPIDSVSPDGKYASSFSYERLESLMPGYGYRYNDESYLNHNAPSETGLFLVDIEQNKKELLLSLKDLSESSRNDPESANSRHYITHSEFSHDGRYISFLHRWVGNDVIKRWSRLIVYDLVARDFIVLPVEEMVSHYVWNKQNQIIAYCKIDGIDCHVLFNVPDINVYQKVLPKVLNSDGHQSFLSDNEFITDTYPNKRRMASMFHVDISSSAIKKIASVYSPKKYQTKDFSRHIACDLHPRVSPNGDFVCFDSPRTGIRSLYIMPIT